MKRIALAVASVLALTGVTAAQETWENKWVLLTLGWSNGSGAYPNMGRGLLPSFMTKGECEIALGRALEQNHRLSHAAGGGNMYLCSNLDDWAV